MGLIKITLLTITFCITGCATSLKLSKEEKKDLARIKKNYKNHYGWDFPENIVKVEYQDYAHKINFGVCLDFRDGGRRVIFNSSNPLSPKHESQLINLCSIEYFHYTIHSKELYF